MPKGAVQLEIGMQSFNEETLKAINRKTNTKRLVENIKKLLSFENMHIHIDLIAGLTGEDMESFILHEADEDEDFDDDYIEDEEFFDDEEDDFYGDEDESDFEGDEE